MMWMEGMCVYSLHEGTVYYSNVATFCTIIIVAEFGIDV